MRIRGADAAEFAAEPDDGGLLHGYRAAFEGFTDVSQALSAGQDLEDLLHLVCDRVCSLTRSSRSSIFLKDHASGLFRGQVASARKIDGAMKGLVAGLPADRFTREILATRRPVLIPNTGADPRPMRSAMRKYKIISMLGVPMIANGEVMGLVFVDNIDEPLRLSVSQIELAAVFANLAAIGVAQAQLSSQLQLTCRELSRNNTTLSRAIAIGDQLTDLSLNGASVAEIAAAVTRLIGRRVVLHDEEFRRLATSSVGDELSVPSVLDEPFRNEPQIQEALECLDGRSIRITNPMPSVGLPHRFLVAPLTVREHCHGYLVMMELSSGFSAVDALVARRAAAVMALEIVAERREAVARVDSQESFIVELLRGVDDAASTKRRGALVGIDVDVPRVVGLIAANPDRPEDAVTALEVSRFCLDRSVDALICATLEGVALAIDVSNREDPLAAARDVVMTVCQGLRPGATLAAGVSFVCRSPGAYEAAYADVRQVVTCIQRHLLSEEGHVVVAADEIKPITPLLSGSTSAEIQGFVVSTLGSLLTQSNPTVRETLARYFACSRNFRRTAAALRVHENTVRYRVARAEDLLGRPIVGDADTEMALELALRMLPISNLSSATHTRSPELFSSREPGSDPRRHGGNIERDLQTGEVGRGGRHQRDLADGETWPPAFGLLSN